MRPGKCEELEPLNTPIFPFAIDGENIEPYIDPLAFSEQISPSQMFGLDLRRAKGVVIPPQTYDLMSYCYSPKLKWISKFHYLQLIDGITSKFGGDQPLRASQAADHLVIQGYLGGDRGGGFFYPPRRAALAASMGNWGAGGYTFRALNQLGVPVYESQFSPEQHPDALDTIPLPSGVFSVALSASLSVHEVQVRAGADLLASMKISANAPHVNLLSPNGGEVIGEQEFEIQWSGLDPDGDSLWYTVEFSRDNGLTWNLLAADIRETSVRRSGAGFPATTNALIRVTGSDGFLSATDQSDQPFQIASAPALIEIQSPNDLPNITTNQSLVLHAEIRDLRDTVADAEVRWLSGDSRVLGTGRQLIVPAASLGIGPHRITVTARNTHQIVSSNSLDIVVLRQPPPRISAERTAFGSLVIRWTPASATLQGAVAITSSTTWIPIRVLETNVAQKGGSMTISPGMPWKFFRAVTPP